MDGCNQGSEDCPRSCGNLETVVILPGDFSEGLIMTVTALLEKWMDVCVAKWEEERRGEEPPSTSRWGLLLPN